MSDRRVFRWATTSARLLAGTLVAVAFVVGVVTAVSVPWPTVAREPVAIEATPAPSASVLVCTGRPACARSRARGRRTRRDRGAADRHERRRAGRSRPDHAAARLARRGRHRAADVRGRAAERRRADGCRGIRLLHGLGRGPARFRRIGVPPGPHGVLARRRIRRDRRGGRGPARQSRARFPRPCSSRSSEPAGAQVPAGGSELVVAPGCSDRRPARRARARRGEPGDPGDRDGRAGAGRAAGEHHPHAAPGRRGPGRRDRRAGSRCR